MDHPLSTGFIQAISPAVWTNSGTQKVQLKVLSFKNESSVSRTLTVQMWNKATLLTLCNGVTLESGHNRDFIEPGKEIVIDPGGVFMAVCDVDNAISFIIDGDEIYDSKKRV